MMNVGSLSGSGTVFDLDSQAGITHLLASIRSSALLPEQKSELRDLIFLYTNGGKDQTVRIALEQKIAAYGLAPAPHKATAEKMPPVPPIGTYRPAPSFQAPVVSAPQPAPAVAFNAAPAWQPAPPPSPEPVPAAATQFTVSPNVTQVPVTPPPVQQSVPVTPAPPAPAPVSTPAPAPAAPVMGADDQQYLKRIREIKAIVNEKVGNPVNLVDINNEVGREYMGALLDAMKKLNSGSSSASAMQRLETAFAAVEKALEDHSRAAAPAAQPAPVVTPPPVAAPAPARAPEPAPVAPPQPQSEPVFLDDHKVTPIGSSYSEAPVAPKSAPQAAPEPVEEPTPWVAAEPAKPAAPAFTSLADLKEKPHNISELPTSASLKTSSVAGDPLFTKEVDDGLQQLLMEWPIFKKSGLFGSGPKGKDHPLFKKMGPLQIPLLLAGRFEGATQEIKQSVTDYMNGWRYEQGLIYQQGETFEHYLRRVIRHILDLQKGK